VEKGIVAAKPYGNKSKQSLPVGMAKAELSAYVDFRKINFLFNRSRIKCGMTEQLK